MKYRLTFLCVLLLLPAAAQAQTFMISANMVQAPDPATTGYYIDSGTVRITFLSDLFYDGAQGITFRLAPSDPILRLSISHLPKALAGENLKPMSVLAGSDYCEFQLPAGQYPAGSSLTISGLVFDVYRTDYQRDTTKLLGTSIKAYVSSNSPGVTFTSQEVTISRVAGPSSAR